MSKTNLDSAVLSILRVGTFSEGEKDALVKAFRTSGFPGNLEINNPVNTEVLRYDGVNWTNAPGGAVEFVDLADTPVSITVDGFVKGNATGDGLEFVTNVAETDAAETVSGAWNFTTAPTISSQAVITAASSIDALTDVDTTGKASGDFLKWNGANWIKQTLTFDYLNPMTTSQDIIVGGTAGAGTRLGVGTNGQVLTVTAGNVGWATPASGFADPMTTRGDVIYRNSSNTTTRLGVGTVGQYLYSDGTDMSWHTPTFDATSPMTTNEDLIKQSGGTAARLPVGTNGQVLTVTGGVVGWATPASGFADPMTTRGDVIVRDNTNTTNRLAVGTNGQVLTSDGTDVSWQTPSSGVSTFLALSDTPGSFATHGLEWVRVNTGATALEFVTAPVSSVAGTGAIQSSGGTAPTISIVAASGTVPGTMSSAHYTKLNGIETGADVTDAANVAAAGAIMDSNYTVNGMQVRTASGTYTSRTITGTSPVSVSNGDGVAGNPTISVAAASSTAPGIVELATNTEANTGTDTTRAVTPANLAAWTGASTITTIGTLASLTVSGTATVGTLNATSARDRKTQVPWFIDPDQLHKLAPIAYTLNDDQSHKLQIGYFADEVAKVYPEVVAFMDGKAVGIDYSRLVVPAIIKINQQDIMIANLEDKVDQLEARLRRLEELVG